jgi:EmrB/QacA subfamily drug resistance transporter
MRSFRFGQGPSIWANATVSAALRHGPLARREPLVWFSARPGYRWWVVGTVCLGALMGQLDASIATLLIPTLRGVFRERLADVEWVAIAYLLALVGLVVLFGRLADMFGRKEMYTLGFAVFTAGSVACGASLTLETLLIARVVQALGAAMLQANSVAIITQAVDRSELGRAIGIQGTAQAVGLSVGPAVGGFLISTMGWQWAFYINLPVGIVGTLLGWLVLPSSVCGKPEPFDWPGLAVFAPGTVIAMYVLTQGPVLGWTSPAIVFLIAISPILMALFLIREQRARFPMVDLRLFLNRLFAAGIAAGLLSYAVLFGALFVIPMFLERALGRSAEATGLTLTAVPIALAVAAPFAGQLADRFGSRGLTAGGMAVSAISLLLLEKVPSGATVRLMAVLALLGLGVGAFTPPNNAAIMGAAPRSRLGVAGGILNMTRGLGTTLGVVATGAVLTWRQHVYALRWRSGGGSATALRVTGAFHDAVLLLLMLAAAAGLISLVRGRPSVLKSGGETEQELL